MRRLSVAENLLKSFGITEPHEIDLEAIAWEIGVEVCEERLDGCEAQIIGLGNNAKVIIDERASRERKRFSIGHELGHWEHHKGQAFICRSDDISGTREYNPRDPERVADQYASDLLLPTYIFSSMVNQSSKCSFEIIRDRTYASYP